METITLGRNGITLHLNRDLLETAVLLRLESGDPMTVQRTLMCDHGVTNDRDAFELALGARIYVETNINP
jgi:hypothetical protein